MKNIIIIFIAVSMFSCRTAKTSVSISNKDSVVAEKKDSFRLFQKTDASIIKTYVDEDNYMLISFDSSAAPSIVIDSNGSVHFTGVKQTSVKHNKKTNITDSSVTQVKDSTYVSAAKDVSVHTHEKVKNKEVKSFTGFYITAFIIILLLITATLIYRRIKK